MSDQTGTGIPDDDFEDEDYEDYEDRACSFPCHVCGEEDYDYEDDEEDE